MVDQKKEEGVGKPAQMMQSTNVHTFFEYSEAKYHDKYIQVY